MRAFILSTTAFIAITPTIAFAEADALPPLPPVAAYESPAEGEEFRICTGGTGGAYFMVGAQIAGMVEAYSQQLERMVTRVGDASPVPGGGTYGCLGELASGSVDAAIIQNDGRAILRSVSPELASELDNAGPVLTEEIITICSRRNDHEDFGDVGQTSGQLITVAGSDVSGTNVMLNVIASNDVGFRRPTYLYEANFYEAVDEVAGGDADCAVGVLSIDSPVMQRINDDFGDEVRLVGSWDNNYRDLENRGEQVYGWRAIPEDTPGLEKLLSWRGDGRGMWSPEVVTVSAVVVYREGLSEELVEILERAAEQNADLKEVNS